MERDKATFLQELASGEMTFTFVKKDGTDRMIRGTRNPALIPGEFHGRTIDELLGQDVIPVYDLDQEGWRAFNYATIKD